MSDELQEFSNAIGAYMKQRKLTVEKAMGVQGRLLVKRVLEFTPPKTLAQGRKAVARDIKKSVNLLDPLRFTSERIRKLIKSGNHSLLTSIFAKFKTGRVKGLRVIPFSKEEHEKNRDRRGRARVNKTTATVDKQAVNAYTKQVQNRVGMAKGGWAAAYQKFSGKAANWYGRHALQGTVVDGRKDPLNPYLLMSNRSPWAGGDSDQIVRSAISARTRDIKKDIEQAHLRAIKARLKSRTKGLKT